jgi:hypothetical protein
MTEHPPSPVMAAVGLVVTAADGLRQLPHVLGSAGHAAARRYDEFALRGQEVLAGRPHLGGAGTAAARGAEAAGGPVTVVGPAEVAEPRTVGEPPGGAEPEVAAEPPIGRTEPVVLPDHVLEAVAQMTPGADLAHDELPLADFDHQTVPQLRGRLRTLGLAELVQLRDYEQAHAARLPVLTLLDNRIARLLADTEK